MTGERFKSALLRYKSNDEVSCFASIKSVRTAPRLTDLRIRDTAAGDGCGFRGRWMMT